MEDSLIKDNHGYGRVGEWLNTEIANNSELAFVSAYLQQIYQNYSPEFIYYKTLYNLFEDFLNDKIRKDIEQKQVALESSEIWKQLYDFQKDGVKGAIQKSEKYNGCILADSVGLGKTFEALGVINLIKKPRTGNKWKHTTNCY